MPNLHPLFTHFPIALLTVGFFVDLVSLLSRNDQVERTGWLVQLIGTIGLAATVVTGLLAKSTVSITGLAQSSFEAHEEIAFVVLSLFLILLFWRVSSRRLLPSRGKGIYMFLFGATVVLLWVGAWYGGEIVYRYGVGVRTLAK